MGQFTRFIAWAAFGASFGLCVLDFITSVRGIWIILGERDDDIIASLMPVILATLAISFNGLSPFMFRMYRQGDFTKFTTTVTCIMWVTFVTYDFVSSFIGTLASYARNSVDSWPSMMAAIRQLGLGSGFIILLMAMLMSFGPFLCTMFYELAREGSYDPAN